MKKNLQKLGVAVCLAVIIIFILFPFYWMFVTSIKPDEELYGLAVTYWPKNLTWASYNKLFSRFHYLKYFKNSMIVAATTTVLSLTISTMASYAFSRYRFRGRKLLQCMFLSNNMFPAVLLLIPLYTIMRKLSILYTPLAMILANTTFTIPFSIWMLNGYMNDIPSSLEEAAMVDGANRFQAFVKIIMPVLLPCQIAVGVYIFMTSWNEYTFANLFSNSASRTIPVALRTLIGELGVEWGMMTAGGVITILPVLIMFFFVQKRLISGLTAGAVKG